jgi:hypothetical protein
LPKLQKWPKKGRGPLGFKIREFGERSLEQCAEKVNVNKNENNLTRKTSLQCKGRWNSMKRKYLGERAHEDEIGGTKSQWPLFNKIKNIIGSSPKVIGLSNAIDSGEKSKRRGSQKKEKRSFDLNDEPLSPSPSDSSNDTSKHDDSSEEGKDDLGNKRLGVSSKK